MLNIQVHKIESPVRNHKTFRIGIELYTQTSTHTPQHTPPPGVSSILISRTNKTAEQRVTFNEIKQMSKQRNYHTM